MTRTKGSKKASGPKRKWRYFSCDFETTVWDEDTIKRLGEQTYTEVWASAVVELGSEDVQIFHSIDETFEYFRSLKGNLVCYYHNLKFDGNFWLYYFLNVKHWKQATYKTGDDEYDIAWVESKNMMNNTFEYSVSDRGQWYTITFKVDNFIVQLRDSLKLLPFSVKAIGKAFKTKHQKLEMEYKGFRYAGCPITDDEKKYIANDVLVVKEALEKMFSDGYNKLTIGACCLSQYKQSIDPEMYKAMFPDLTEVYPSVDVDASTADEYIRHSYRGGWCYLAKGKENKLYTNGTTADVNSLYPSMMSSESGNYYPVGYPHWWKGNEIPEKARDGKHYYFLRIRTRFYLKPGMLPFIQIKGSLNYKGTEMLETSDLVNKETGDSTAFTYNEDGVLEPVRVTMTMTMTDFKLFLEHYDVEDFEILDGCYFATEIGIFDTYISHWAKIKMESKGAMRTEAKLFLNNLYGKMASNTDSSFKYAYMKEDESVGFVAVEEHAKRPGYIPVGSAITSYARNFTIRAAQLNYYGPDKPGFIYADTDSIHCDLKPEEFKGVPVDPVKFCHWKLESSWDKGLFVRQKTYMEHVVAENLEPIDESYWNVKCAGMPDNSKKYFLSKMEAGEMQLSDFKVGLKVPGKLVPKRIKGGVLLVETNYEMRGI